MPSQNPKKVHLADRKTTRCGRPLGTTSYETTTDESKVTCTHCTTPNRPFTYGKDSKR